MQNTLAKSEAAPESEVEAAKRAAANAGYDVQVAEKPAAAGGVVGVLVNGPDDAAFVMDTITEALADRDVFVVFESVPLPRYLMHVHVAPVEEAVAANDNENDNDNAEAAR